MILRSKSNPKKTREVTDKRQIELMTRHGRWFEVKGQDLGKPAKAGRLAEKAEAPKTPSPFADIKAIDDRLAKSLIEAEIMDVDDLKEATDEQLLAIKGIAPARLATIREQLG